MKEYHIKKGNHYSGLHIGFTIKKSITFCAMFDASCLYDLQNPTQDYNHNYDINKLYGFCTSLYHEYESARVGFRCLDNKTIQLVTYVHNDWTRIPETILGNVLPGQTFQCSISDNETGYTFTFKNGTDSMTTIIIPKNPTKFKFRYLLHPFFGGTEVAPSDMVIWIGS